MVHISQCSSVLVDDSSIVHDYSSVLVELCQPLQQLCQAFACEIFLSSVLAPLESKYHLFVIKRDVGTA